MHGHETVGKNELTRYALYILERHTIDAQRAILCTLKSFFSYLTDIKQTYLTSPARNIHIPRKNELLPKNLPTDEAFIAWLDSINIKNKARLKDKAMFELLYSTAMRIGELRNLNLEDVNFKSDTVLIRKGKGGKDRMVPMGKRAKEYLLKYLKVARPRHANGYSKNALFITIHGRRLSEWTPHLIFKKYASEMKITPHAFRHKAALGMLKNGADIRYIQELLGHSDLSATQIYLKTFPKDLQAAHKKHHPRSK